MNARTASEPRFSNREITALFERIDERLDEHGRTHEKILTQVLYTNGKVKRLYTYLTIIGTATVTILATNSAEFIAFIKLFL